MTTSITRKQFLIGAGVTAGAAMLRPFSVRAARPIVIKIGIDQKLDNPITQHLITTANRIKTETNGEVDMQVFPNNELGTDMNTLAGVRSGAVQMMAIGDNILSTLVPSAAIDNVGFAFNDSETVYAAVDGAVGDLVRADIMKRGLYPMRAIWSSGFRQVTTNSKPINTPESMKGLLIRVPESPIALSLFKNLGAAPETLDYAAVYTALQTHVMDGQENSIGDIETQKYYQVQKYCSLTSHMWVGNWMIMNGTFWKGLPSDHQKVIAGVFDAQAAKARAAFDAFDRSMQAKLTSQGLKFNKPDRVSFRAALAKKGFYDAWQKKFGSGLWSALEKYTGPLG